MAKNIVDKPGYSLSLVVTDPAVPVSGDPVLVGPQTGIAMTAEGEGGNAPSNTTIELGPYVATHSVKAVDGGGNSAVAVNDKIYYVSGDTPVLSKKATGVFYGYAMETITSGSTATIMVRHPAN